MLDFVRLRLLIAGAALLAVTAAGLEARTKKGDKLAGQGREAEQRQQYDQALTFYEQALSEDPGDPGYILLVRRGRFQAGQAHVDKGQKLRDEGKLDEALKEFEQAYAIDPSSSIAEQEIRRTRAMIEREKKKAEEKTESKPEERGMTPAEMARKRTEEKMAALLPVPELRPINQQPINLIMNNQPPKVLWETVGKLAGVNVIFDPDYMTQGPVKNQSVEFTNTTLEEALDYLGVMTKSFWKPLSSNTILVTNDTTPKRRDYEEQVLRVFYLSNITTAQELQELVSNIRTMTEIKRIFPYNSQSAIVVRGTADQVALAEKLVADLDKPRSEVVVDAMVLSATKARTRDLTTAVAQSGLSVPVVFNPRNKITNPSKDDTSGDGDSSSDTSSIRMGDIGKLTEKDWAITLPGGLLEAIMSDRNTRLLQSPKVRVADGQKAVLHVGDRVPTATGSYSPGIGGVGINALVNTQFQYLDTGVKIEITPKVHQGDEVSMHVDAEISSVRDYVDLGGISQPVLSQTKVTHDIRIKEGEVSVLGGLLQTQDTKTVTGVPGLASIPVLRRLFTSEGVEKSESELLIVLIPHIVRSPDINPENVKTIDVGTDQVIKLSYPPRKPAPGEPPPPIAPKTAAPPATAPAPVKPAAPQAAPPATAAPGAPPATAPPIIPGVTLPPPAAKPAPAPAAAGQAARILVTPAQIQGAAGSAVNVTVNVENVADLLAATMRLKYDPKIVRLNDVIQGDLLSKDGRPAAPVSKNILNDTGDATVALRRFPDAGGVGGSGALVTFVFQMVSPGTTTVTFSDLTLRNPQLRPIVSGAPPLTVTVK